MKINLTLFIVFLMPLSVFSQWVQTAGPNGGYTNEIVQVGTELILSAGNGGIYKSVDNGETWESSVSGLPCDEGVLALVEYNGLIYASISRNGIYFSNDSGNNWVALNTGIENLTFYSLFVDDSNIYAGNANGGVYYSPDNGITWNDKSNGIDNIQFQDFILFNSKIYAAGTSLFETSDNGDTWVEVNIPGLSGNGIRAMTAENNIFYASSNGTVFTSTDNLNSWNTYTINNNGASIVSMSYSNNTVYLTTSLGRYFYTNDSGVNWSLVQNPNTDSFVHNLFFTNSSILMSTTDGVYESIDTGAIWSRRNNGLRALQIKSLEKNNLYIFAGTVSQGVFRSADNGENWTLINNGLNNTNALYIDEILAIGNTIFIATGDGIYKSTNNGNSWERKLNPGINKSNQGLDSDNGVFATGVSGTGVYISTDNGETWNLTSTNGLNIDTSYYSVKIDDNVIVVSTHSGEMFISTDLGNTWTDISITSSYHLTYDFEFINNNLYAATTKGLMVSSDLGQNWSLFNNDQKNILDVVFDGEKIYIATDLGMYIATKEEKIWYDLCEGMGKLYTNKLLINNNILFAGTFGNSVWKRYKIDGNLPPVENSSTIGVDKLSLCSNSSPVNLYTEIGIPLDSNGVWTPNLTNPNGIFNPLVDTPGIYTFTYDSDLCDCENYLKIEVSLDGQANAGNDTDLTLCEENISINLFENIDGNPDTNGTWSPQLASGTNIFNPSIDVEGIYTYTVSSVDCGTDTSEIDVKIIDIPNAGIDSNLTLCEENISINLFENIDGNPDLDGIWSPQLASGTNIFNPSIDVEGIYTYTIDNGSCQSASELSITIVEEPNAGIDSNLTLCEENISINLFENIDGNPDINGTWSPQLASGTNIFNPSIDVEGIYTYTVSSVDCGAYTSEIDVKIIDIPNAGIDSNLTLCEENISINLFENIDGNPDLGGVWSPQLASGTNIFNPSIDVEGIYTYTIDNGSCQLASELSITIVEEPNAGIDSSLILCKKDTSINLYENINGDPDLGGIWSPQLASGTNIFNPSIDVEGIYTYTIDNGFCQSVSELNITIVERSNNVIDYTIDIVDFSNSNSITVTINSGLQYEYSLDGILYQTSNIFNNLNGGMYTVFGREIEGCDYFEKEIFILDYPRFFTPNNDGYNDVWQIIGISNKKYDLYIFNRYGKLLKILDNINDNWDGIYNGSKMPSTDYWFKIVLEDGISKEGHFSLRR